MLRKGLLFKSTDLNQQAMYSQKQAFFWRFVGAFNIITDCMLIALPLVIIAPRQMKRKKKLLILISFSTRFL
jgi:hypothetical protein